MNSWIRFFKENQNLVLFGFLLTFCSGFGQTFLVAIFVPEILEEFGLSNASFGSYYATATLLSALCLTWAGRYIDRMDLRYYSWIVIAGMVVSLLIFSQATHMIMLVAGLWGMRLSGQGLMSHTAITTMARYFDNARGKAISITTLGHPAGSAILPLAIALGIEYLGWRQTLLYAAILLAILLPPLLSWLLRKTETNPATFRDPEKEERKESDKESPSYMAILRSSGFWLMAPGAMAIPFMNTAFFFYQLPLAEAKGWSSEWVAASFSGYAIASAFCMIVAGQLIDKLSAARLFPYFLFPLLGSLLLVIGFDSPWITPVYLILIGFSSGFGNTIKSALQAEIFGVEYLGTVRSLFTALMVVSTALGPAAFGLLLDAGLSFEETFGIAAIFLLLIIAWNFRIIPKSRYIRWYLRLRP